MLNCTSKLIWVWQGEYVSHIFISLEDVQMMLNNCDFEISKKTLLALGIRTPCRVTILSNKFENVYKYLLKISGNKINGQINQQL